MTPRSRPGGRSARVRNDVLAATRDLLQQSGFAGLTIDGVAERAGVHRTTIHRRWASRAALVADALLDVSADQVAVPNTGTLRADLRHLARAIRDAISTPLARALASALTTAGSGIEVGEVGRRFWEARFSATGAIVERAVARGELPERTSSRFVVEALGGPIWFRVFVVREPADVRFLHRVVDMVIAGLQEEKR
jgi:AcrR family transcriptional regulator